MDIKELVKDCGGTVVTADGAKVVEVRFDPASFADFVERLRQLPPEGYRLQRIPTPKVKK